MFLRLIDKIFGIRSELFFLDIITEAIDSGCMIMKDVFRVIKDF